MKTLSIGKFAVVCPVAVLILATAQICLAADVPAGSLVMKGPKRTETGASSRSAPGTNSPEHLFGLRIEAAMKTNGWAIVAGAFDVDAFYRRFIPSLPVSEEVKQALLAAPRETASLRNQVLDEAVRDIRGLPYTRFLGTRLLGDDCALLFRDMDGTGMAFEVVFPTYTAYIAGRQPDGSIRLVDAHRFKHGELLSQWMRRRTLVGLAKKRLLTGDRLNATDQQLVSGLEPLWLFESRCDYGKFSLIKEAYDKLAPEVQNDRLILFRYATTGDRNADEVLAPVERWRKAYPQDPTPNLVLIDFYWLLYKGPRYVTEGPLRGTHFYEAWTPQEEEAVEAAIERANAWFADPRMEARLASYYGVKRPEKSRPLLQKAIHRFPAEPIAFDELLKVDLANSHFTGVAETLHLDELAFHTNLTQMVNVSTNYAAFRKSFSWKQWQEADHQAKTETAKVNR